MAHRQGLLSVKVWTFLAAGLVLAALMAGRVLILNQMTNMRANIAVLEDRKGFLETRSAILQKTLNHETSAAVICRRARNELKLFSPLEPGLVLVKLPDESGRSSWTWPAWLEGLAGGDQAQAGDFPRLETPGKMVHLSPVTMRTPNASGAVH